MRKCLFSLLIVTLIVCFYSINSQANDRCESIESLAETIMEKRQSGYPMSALIKAVSNTGDKKGQDAVKIMILKAYDYPNYSTSEYEREAIVEFKNIFYKMCIKDELSN